MPPKLIPEAAIHRLVKVKGLEITKIENKRTAKRKVIEPFISFTLRR
ncbi:hypothetical protein J7L49_06655 [Candidatus Bathyarchaeota archaeon]|nr:hypothetical protein [Candidatus Bathyarchaeota archaeon]